LKEEYDMKQKGVLKRSGTSLATQEAKTSFAETHLLSQPEENALRMLHGIGVDAQDLLPKACGGNEEVADELLLVEMQLFRAARMRQSQAGVARPSPQKNKIISALRAKK
jgi:hypothetical protein